MKRKISFALVLCLLMSVIPFGALTAVAADGVDAQYWAADQKAYVTDLDKVALLSAKIIELKNA